MRIKIDLTRMSEEAQTACDVFACRFISDREMTEGEKLARDIVAPLAVAELMRKEGNAWQKSNASQLGRTFYNCGAVCGGAIWFCGDREESQALTLADGYRVRGMGQIAKGGAFVLIVQNENGVLY